MSSLVTIPNTSISTNIGYPGDIVGYPYSIYFGQLGQTRRGYDTRTPVRDGEQLRNQTINLKGLDPAMLEHSSRAYDKNNEYIPLFNILCYNLLSVVEESTQLRTNIIEYGIPNIVAASEFHYGVPDRVLTSAYGGLSSYTRRYNDAIESLISGSHICILRYTFEAVERKLIFSRGIIFTPEGKPLMIVGVKRETFLSIIRDFDVASEVELTNENTVLFISREFSENPEYRNVYRRVHSDFILPLIAFKLDVIESHNIERWALKTTELDYRFPTISKMTEHCETVVSDYFNDVL